MGSVIAEGIERAGGEARLFSIEEPIDQEYVDACDGVIIGTPTWVANTCWQIKKWFDVDSRSLNLAGKLGGVYATAHYAQGGADVALLTMIGHMMVKGMVLYSGGASLGKPFIHLGPVAWILWEPTLRTAGRISESTASGLQRKPENCLTDR